MFSTDTIKKIFSVCGWVVVEPADKEWTAVCIAASLNGVS